MKTKETEVLRR